MIKEIATKNYMVDIVKMNPDFSDMDIITRV